MKWIACLAVLSSMIFARPSLASPKEWSVATLEWPPFICQSCPEQGASAAALRAVLKSQGIDLKLTFYPWTRAIHETRAGRFIAYFPSWPEACKPPFFFSEAFSYSPLGIAEHKDKPLQWTNLEDLGKFRVGVVLGYSNTKEFNELVDKGKIKVDVVVDDLLNLKKLSAKRIDAALFDVWNYRFFAEQAENKPLVANLQLNAKVIARQPIGLCMHEDHRHGEYQSYLKGLKAVDSSTLSDEYLKRFFKIKD